MAIRYNYILNYFFTSDIPALGKANMGFDRFLCQTNAPITSIEQIQQLEKDLKTKLSLTLTGHVLKQLFITSPYLANIDEVSDESNDLKNS